MKDKLPHIVVILNRLSATLYEGVSQDPATTAVVYRGTLRKDCFDEELCRDSYHLWMNLLRNQLASNAHEELKMTAQNTARMFVSALQSLHQNQKFDTKIEAQLKLLIEDIDARLLQSFA